MTKETDLMVQVDIARPGLQKRTQEVKSLGNAQLTSPCLNCSELAAANKMEMEADSGS